MKKLSVVLFMVLSLPVVASMVGSRHQAQAFNSVAVAGRSTAGGGALMLLIVFALGFALRIIMRQ